VKNLVVMPNYWRDILYFLHVCGVEFYRYGFTIVKPVATFLWLIFEGEPERSNTPGEKKKETITNGFLPIFLLITNLELVRLS